MTEFCFWNETWFVDSAKPDRFKATEQELCVRVSIMISRRDRFHKNAIWPPFYSCFFFFTFRYSAVFVCAKRFAAPLTTLLVQSERHDYRKHYFIQRFSSIASHHQERLSRQNHLEKYDRSVFQVSIMYRNNVLLMFHKDTFFCGNARMEWSTKPAIGGETTVSINIRIYRNQTVIFG